ncbi:MAG TPA: hypothetical protein VHB70_17695, partial [Parafilimonas sp.]|nr:hypothetical protein [Parafilimonas sp.]
MKKLIKKLSICALGLVAHSFLFSQLDNSQNIYRQIIIIDKSSQSNAEKLDNFYTLKSKIENTQPLNDSAYILDFLKISKYEFRARNDYETSIAYAIQALKMCYGLKKENLKFLRVNACYNLASSYQKLGLSNRALAYYDTVIALCDKNFVD